MYVLSLRCSAVSMAAAGLSTTALMSERRRIIVRAASACLWDLASECTIVASTKSSSGPCRKRKSRRTAFFSSLELAVFSASILCSTVRSALARAGCTYYRLHCTERVATQLRHRCTPASVW